MSTPNMTGSQVHLRHFHAFPAEEVCHFPVESVVYINKAVGAFTCRRELARVHPWQAAMEAFAGRVGVFPGISLEAVVQRTTISCELSGQLADVKWGLPGSHLSTRFRRSFPQKSAKSLSLLGAETRKKDASAAACSLGTAAVPLVDDLASSCAYRR